MKFLTSLAVKRLDLDRLRVIGDPHLPGEIPVELTITHSRYPLYPRGYIFVRPRGGSHQIHIPGQGKLIHRKAHLIAGFGNLRLLDRTRQVRHTVEIPLQFRGSKVKISARFIKYGQL